MNQRTLLLNLITEYCQQRGSRTFTLQELNQTYQDFQCINIGGKTPQTNVRRLLQELRDDKILSFLDKRGAYSLKTIDILDNEVEENAIDIIAKRQFLRKKNILLRFMLAIEAGLSRQKKL